jgi:hypothetical protein
LLDQLDVFFHDIFVVIFVCQLLMLVGFGQRDEAALKILLLALEFLLDFTINFYVFLLIVLNVLKEVGVD